MSVPLFATDVQVTGIGDNAMLRFSVVEDWSELGVGHTRRRRPVAEVVVPVSALPIAAMVAVRGDA